jgi:hypothetical protein
MFIGYAIETKRAVGPLNMEPNTAIWQKKGHKKYSLRPVLEAVFRLG